MAPPSVLVVCCVAKVLNNTTFALNLRELGAVNVTEEGRAGNVVCKGVCVVWMCGCAAREREREKEREGGRERDVLLGASKHKPLACKEGSGSGSGVSPLPPSGRQLPLPLPSLLISTHYY